MNIRNAKDTEFDEITALYASARTFMAEHGNPAQWGEAYPSLTLIRNDMRDNNLYICEEEGEVLAVFFYKYGDDATYEKIYDGAWETTGPYGVIHRIASTGKKKGTASFCLEWALKKCGCLRIDTHRDNTVMQNLLKKNGFSYCGIIYVGDDTVDGTSRLAYEKSVVTD